VTRVLAALLLLVGIVLLPLRATAATIPMLIAYDMAAWSTATMQVETGASVRSERGGAPEYVYDDVLEATGSAANPREAACAGPVHAYDGALERPEPPELAKGMIYDAPVATTAAKGGGGGGGQKFTPEQQDLVEMAKGDKAAGGVTPEDMEAYKELNAQAGANGFTEPGAVRGPEVHPPRTPQSPPGPGQQPHGHVGPVGHIPVRTVP
jgi:hypothetical protein